MRYQPNTRVVLALASLPVLLVLAGCGDETEMEEGALPERPPEDAEEDEVESEPNGVMAEYLDGEPDFDLGEHFVAGDAFPPSLFSPGDAMPDAVSYEPFQTSWDAFRPLSGYYDGTWSNKEDLWDATVLEAWDDALVRFGEELAPYTQTIFPGVDFPSYGTYWYTVEEEDQDIFLFNVYVGLYPEDDTSGYPDTAWYSFQISESMDGGEAVKGEVVARSEPCRIDGSLEAVLDETGHPADVALDECLGGHVEAGTFTPIGYPD